MTNNGEHGDSLELLLPDLADESKPLRAALVYRLSDPSEDDLAKLKAGWKNVPVERRRLLMSRLAETSEASFEVNFAPVALFALHDEDPLVRRYAVATLWEDESLVTMHRFVHLLREDASAEVRAAAAEALGKFVLAGELGAFPDTAAREAEEALLEAYSSEHAPLEVQRRALESLAYARREEIPDLIEEAQRHDDLDMRTTAIFAMGRSADNRWARQVIAALDHVEPKIRYEATRAAGELAITAAVARLIQLAHGPDREIKEVAIWSLGEIGGSQAQQALLKLADQEDDDDLLETIEDAINSAALGSGEFVTYMLSTNDDEDELDEEDDGLYND